MCSTISLQWRCLTLSIACLTTMSLSPSQVIVGDTGTTSASFSFPLSTHIYNRVQGTLVVGAGQSTTGAAASFALAVTESQASVFTPLISSATATINYGTTVVPNPLFGAQIDALSLINMHPVVVLNNDPGNVYVIQNNNVNTFSLLTTGILPDAASNPTAGVVALGTNSSSGELRNLFESGTAIFAAVKNAGGQFGVPGSGIASAILLSQSSDLNKLQFQQITPTAPLDINSGAVRIGDSLTSMNAPVVMFSDDQLRLMYVGLQVQAGATPTDGAHAVIAFETSIALVNGVPQPPILSKLVVDGAVTADSIIATVGASATISINKLATMRTTTGLRYLIVVGGTANDPSRAFALPLVTETGALANKNADPINIFSQDAPFFFLSRTLPAAQVPGDLYTSALIPANLPANIGGGIALPGDITDIFVSGDSVFVSVGVAVSDNPGIFYSQALFDSGGKIKGWTDWQRAGGAIDQTFGLALDERFGNFWTLTGATSGSVSTVKRTEWTASQAGLSIFVNAQLPQQNGGVQRIFDFPRSTPSFNQSTNPLAVTIATGNKRVVIAQTGQNNGAIFGPNANFGTIFNSTNGTLQGFVPGVTALSCTGGVLNMVGPVIAATVVNDGNFGWFVVGGAHGVAVLMRPDGSGWPLNPGLQNGFASLTTDMQWVQLGNFSAVRKLVAGQNLLYVLTQNGLARLAVSAATLQTGARAVSATLAQAGDLPGGRNAFLSDVIISNKVGLLATSSGLLRVGNGSDITTATNVLQIGWVPIALAESVGPVSRLFAISPTGIETGVAQLNSSGNVYVLSAYIGYDQARVYRLTIDYTGAIDDTTVTQFPDFIIQGQKTFFLTIGSYRNFLTTDGAILALSRSRYIAEPLFLQLLDPAWMLRFSRTAVQQAKLVVTDQLAHNITHMIRSSVVGQWLAPGEFGLIVNQ